MQVLLFLPESGRERPLLKRLASLRHEVAEVGCPAAARTAMTAAPPPDVLLVAHSKGAYPECEIRNLLADAKKRGLLTAVLFGSWQERARKEPLGADAEGRMCAGMQELEFLLHSRPAGTREGKDEFPSVLPEEECSARLLGVLKSVFQTYRKQKSIEAFMLSRLIAKCQRQLPCTVSVLKEYRRARRKQGDSGNPGDALLERRAARRACRRLLHRLRPEVIRAGIRIELAVR